MSSIGSRSRTTIILRVRKKTEKVISVTLFGKFINRIILPFKSSYLSILETIGSEDNNCKVNANFLFICMNRLTKLGLIHDLTDFEVKGTKSVGVRRPNVDFSIF